MWVISTVGFLSIVRKGEGKLPYQVRFREWTDAQNVAELLDIKPENIISNEGTDYAYRIKVDQKGLDKLMKELGKTVNYANFKDAVKHTPDQQHKGNALAIIWSTLLRLQQDTRRALWY